MTTTEIGQSLVALCNAGNFHQAYETLFADNATSIEAMGETATGLENLYAKSEEFGKDHTISNFTATGPYVAGDIFAAHFTMDMTVKATGATHSFQEIALYTVADGKIIEEKFLYGA